MLIIWDSHPRNDGTGASECTEPLGLAINFAAGVVQCDWAYVLSAPAAAIARALSADGQHILSDVVTSVGVLVGLLPRHRTGYAISIRCSPLIVAGNISSRAGR